MLLRACWILCLLPSLVMTSCWRSDARYDGSFTLQSTDPNLQIHIVRQWDESRWKVICINQKLQALWHFETNSEQKLRDPKICDAVSDVNLNLVGAHVNWCVHKYLSPNLDFRIELEGNGEPIFSQIGRNEEPICNDFIKPLAKALAERPTCEGKKFAEHFLKSNANSYLLRITQSYGDLNEAIFFDRILEVPWDYFKLRLPREAGSLESLCSMLGKKE